MSKYRRSLTLVRYTGSRLGDRQAIKEFMSYFEKTPPASIKSLPPTAPGDPWEENLNSFLDPSSSTAGQ